MEAPRPPTRTRPFRLPEWLKRQWSGHPIGFKLSALLISFNLASACSGQETNSPLPPEIRGLPLVQVISGEDAVRMTERLHGKAVAPSETHIGRYGTGSTHAMLYVSHFDSDQEAESVLAAMSASIGDGSSGFGHHEQFSIDRRGVHMVIGQGQVHFFFVRTADLFWLGMDAEMAREGLAQLLGVAAEDVPALESLLSGS